MSIRPNRVKQALAAGRVATILAGSNDPDLIDQLGTLDVDGIWLEGEHGGVDYADLGNLTRACDLWGLTSVLRLHQNEYGVIYRLGTRTPPLIPMLSRKNPLNRYLGILLNRLGFR